MNGTVLNSFPFSAFKRRVCYCNEWPCSESVRDNYSMGRCLIFKPLFLVTWAAGLLLGGNGHCQKRWHLPAVQRRGKDRERERWSSTHWNSSLSFRSWPQENVSNLEMSLHYSRSCLGHTVCCCGTEALKSKSQSSSKSPEPMLFSSEVWLVVMCVCVLFGS